MPNHCSNRLTVKGEPGALKKFLEFARPDIDPAHPDADLQPLDYAKLCPMPDDHVQQYLESQDGYIAKMRRRGGHADPPLKELRDMQTSDDPKEREAAALMLSEAWYGWCVDKWGTKWNCYSGSVNTDSIDTGELVYHFDSAWSPPVGVIQAAAEHFDTLEFRLEYAENGCDFAGVFEAIGDVFSDDCVDGVLSTEYGRELYEEMYAEMDAEEAEAKREREEQEHARHQNDSAGGE